MASSTLMLSSIFLSTLAAAVEARNFTFDHASVALNGSLYQSTYQDGNVFVTSSVGRVVNESYIFKVDGQSLDVLETITPGRDNQSGLLWATYGIDGDSKHSRVWVTNTRLNTVSTYKDSDLSLVAHLPVNTTGHARDVVVDEANGKVYVSSFDSEISVYDSDSLKYEGKIELQTDNQPFKTVMELALDSAKQVLYTVSLNSNVAASIELNNNNKVTYYQLGNATRASAVAYDNKRGHLYVASQGSDEILVVDTNDTTSTTSKAAIKLPVSLDKRAAHDDVSSEIHTAPGGLYAGYEPKNDLVYVVNRLESDVYVIDAENLDILTTLKTGKFPNHVSFDPNGDAWVTDKDTPTRLHRFTPHVEGSSNTTGPANNGTSSASHGNGSPANSGSGASGSGPAATATGRGNGNGGGVAAASGSGSTSSGGRGSAPTANGATHLCAGAVGIILPAVALMI